MPINRLKKFKDEILFRLQEYKKNPKLKKSATSFFDQIGYDKAKNVYNFFWCGIPIIQLPQDIQTKQELIWEYKPEIIIETGVAWGGSLIFYSTMLGMLEDSGHINNGKVIGVEKKLKPSNKEKIFSHPLSKRIDIYEGSSISKEIVKKVSKVAKDKRTIIILDSNHSHKHVLKELKLYSDLIQKNGFIIVEDTAIENLAIHPSSKNWGQGNSPLSAIKEFLTQDQSKSFSVIDYYTDKSIISGMHGGILKKII